MHGEEVVRIWLAKHGRGFLPTDDDGRRIHARMGAGECAEFTIIRPRSIQWHRMYFGICGEIGKNQDPQRDEDSIDHELRILAGHYDVMYVESHEVRIPKRIAFHKLTHDEWAELWPSLELAIRDRFGDEYIRERAA
jgi:hypothetical protein